MNDRRVTILTALAWLASAAMPAVAADAGDIEELRATVQALMARVQELEGEVRTLRGELARSRGGAPAEVAAVKQDLERTRRELATVRASQEEWKHHDSSVHLAGYAAAGYTDEETEDGRFDQVQFNPIFHFSFRDLLLLEAELETKIAEDGSSEFELEYATVDWMVNDYMTLLAGKFLSPLGQFQQNLHPAWINRLPSRPSGFGGGEEGAGGALPLSEVGVELRGGFPVPFTDPVYANYALYVGNGPELELNEDGDAIEAVETEGFARDRDGNKVVGGRLGVLPVPGLELGFSGAVGDVAVAGEGDRNYHALGFDAAWQWRDLRLRGEYIEQAVGGRALSVAPARQRWAAWYAQAAWRILSTPFEAVVRYSDFDSTHADQEQEQWALGLNYLLAPQAMAKVAYEFNDGLRGEPADNDRLLLQITYGF